jgi:hypothetical protein
VVNNQAFDIKEANLILVEGKDDELFVDAFKIKMEINGFQIINIQGKSNLLPVLKLIKEKSELTPISSIGIIMDSNSNPRGTLKEINQSLKKAGYPEYDSSKDSATEKTRINVLLLPDENKPGELEDLCLETIKSDPIMDCITPYFECLKNISESYPRKESKARLQIFLASKDEVVRDPGLAVKKDYLMWDSQHFENVRNFLKEVIS